MKNPKLVPKVASRAKRRNCAFLSFNFDLRKRLAQSQLEVVNLNKENSKK